MSLMELLSDEIEATKARLVALETAYDVLDGTPAAVPTPLKLVEPKAKPAAKTPPQSPGTALRRGRIPDADKHAICDRAHELHSLQAAATEAGVKSERVVAWISEGFGQHKGFPGNSLPADVSADLRNGQKVGASNDA